jgi:hypothetical protein
MAYEGRIRETVRAMLAQHGLDGWLLDRDRRLFNRLALDDQRGSLVMKPGRPGASGFQTTFSLERDARLYWSLEVAAALRRRLYGRTPPPGMALAPALPLAVARSLGLSTEEILRKPSPFEERRSDHQFRLGAPDWVVDLQVLGEGGVILARNGQLFIGDQPETIRATLVGRRLHEVVSLPGGGPGTQVGDLEIAQLVSRSIKTLGAWTTVEPLPEGAERRWIDIALQADAMA